MKEWLGPATLIYVISASFGAIWWASDLSTRLQEVEKKAAGDLATDQRLTRVETILLSVDKQLDKIDAKLDRQTPR